MSERRLKSFLRKVGIKSYLDLAMIDDDSLSYLSNVVDRLPHFKNKAIRTVEEESRYKFINALEILKKNKHVPTGVRGLDRLLGGGVEAGAITEFVGEYGTGKTQLCHQLAVMARVERLGRVLYLDAEGTFRPERIVSISEARGLDPEEALENTIYFKANSSDQLLEVLFASKTLAANLKLALLVFDGVTTLPHYEFSNREDALRRRRKIRDIMVGLRELAWSGIAVVVTNRVVVVPEEERLEPVSGFITGLFSTHRLFLRKAARGVREVSVTFSPILPPRKAYFRVSEEGLIDVDEI